MLALLSLALIMCRSEAFASSHSPFTGGASFVTRTARGGSTTKDQLLHCVTQSASQPRTVTSATSPAANGSLEPNGSSSVNGDTNTHHHKVAVEYVAETKLPTDIGHFQLRAYRVPGAPVGQEPCVIYSRDKPPFGVAPNQWADHVPVRIHDQCLTSEVFRSQRSVSTFLCGSYVYMYTIVHMHVCMLNDILMFLFSFLFHFRFLVFYLVCVICLLVFLLFSSD